MDLKKTFSFISYLYIIIIGFGHLQESGLITGLGQHPNLRTIAFELANGILAQDYNYLEFAFGCWVQI